MSASPGRAASGGYNPARRNLGASWEAGFGSCPIVLGTRLLNTIRFTELFVGRIYSEEARSWERRSEPLKDLDIRKRIGPTQNYDDDA